MDRAFLDEVNHALSLTVQVDGWPDTYGMRQPSIEIAPGHEVGTIVTGDGSDPFRLHMDHPARVLVGERFLDTRLAGGILDRGFSRGQILVQMLAHEAYHSNEGQHLQRCQVPAALFKTLFVAALREELPQDVQSTLMDMATIAHPIGLKFKRDHNNDTVAMAFKNLHQLHTKIDEGAADVYSMTIFQRLFPDDALAYLETLEEIRRQERDRATMSPSRMEQVMAYDNASCLKALRDLAIDNWPKTAVSCTGFALQHAVPFLREEPAFQTISGNLDRMKICLQPLASVGVTEPPAWLEASSPSPGARSSLFKRRPRG